MSGEVRRSDFWEDEGTIARQSAGPKRRRRHRLALTFYGALTAAAGGHDTPEVPPSLATCEQLPTPEGSAGTTANATEQDSSLTTGRVDLTPNERDAVSVALQVGVEDVDRAVNLVRSDERAAQVMYALLEREDETRRAHALALLEEGEGGGALRLARCGRRSVQLECPDEFGAGGCGHDGNYVPISCSHPLCSDCSRKRIGHAVERYTEAVQSWAQPTFYTLTVPNCSDPAAGKHRVQEAFGKLRRRGFPARGDGWAWNGDGPGGWKAELLGNGQHELARDLERRYVNYSWENATGTHRGRRVPWDELVRGGFYGVDVKQKAADEYNVHLHVLADAAYIPQAALSSAWEDVTGDAPVVDVRRIYGRDGETIESAVAETVAYAVKPPEFDEPEDAAAFASDTKGERMVQPFGTLHGNVPKRPPSLLCERCENTPRWWNYVDVVNDRRETVGMVHGEDGDRPPDSS